MPHNLPYFVIQGEEFQKKCQKRRKNGRFQKSATSAINQSVAEKRDGLAHISCLCCHGVINSELKSTIVSQKAIGVGSLNEFDCIVIFPV